MRGSFAMQATRMSMLKAICDLAYSHALYAFTFLHGFLSEMKSGIPENAFSLTPLRFWIKMTLNTRFKVTT